jgi:hypothetical protein
MAVVQFRLKRATIVLFPEDGRKSAQNLPIGSILVADPIYFTERLVDVTWGDKKGTMFAVDLQSRSELVTEGKAKAASASGWR